MGFKTLSAIFVTWLCLMLPAFSAGSVHYSNNASGFAVGNKQLLSGPYQIFRDQVHYYGQTMVAGPYSFETGYGHTDSFNPIKVSDPYIYIRSFNGGGTDVNFALRAQTLISKKTSFVSGSILVNHAIIPTASFNGFFNSTVDDIQLKMGPSGNTEVSVTGNLKTYLNTNFPAKYVTVTIGDAGNTPYKLIYVRNDAGQRIQLTNFNGQILSGLAPADVGRISNVVSVSGGYSFRVHKFSDYGLVTLNSLVWNQTSIVTDNVGAVRSISVRLLDSQSRPVSGAAVTFKKLSGNGSLGATIVTTNALGNAIVPFTFSWGTELNIVSANMGAMHATPNLILQGVANPITIVSINAQYTGINTHLTKAYVGWNGMGPTINTQYQLRYIQGNAIVYQGTSTNFTHLNLPESVTASYVVRAINSGITGNYSVTASVWLPDAHVDGPVTSNNSVFAPFPMQPWSPTVNAVLYRDYNGNTATMSALVLNGASLGAGFDFNAMDFSDIVLTLNAHGLPVARVPNNSDLANFINNSYASGNIKLVPIRFGGINQKGAIITVDLLNGGGVVPITMYGGGQRSGLAIPYQGRLSGFYYSPTQNMYLFSVNRFSEYGIATVSTVNFTIANTTISYGVVFPVSVRVRDTNGDGVENAPVTINILSGSGTILTAIPAVTNVNGLVTFNFQAPTSDQVVVLRANVDSHLTSPTLSLTVRDLITDLTPPTIVNLNPSTGAINVNESTAISFGLTDAQSGVSKNSVSLVVDGVPVVPSLSGPVSQVSVIYQPSVAFGNASTVNVTINAQDASGNVLVYAYAFKVADINSWSITTPLAVPTIFDPLTQSTDLVYNLQKAEDVLVRIYDLAGRRIMERYFNAGAMGARLGNNRIPWLGRDDASQIQSNGIYFFYIIRVSDKNVLGRGKIVISKSY